MEEKIRFLSEEYELEGLFDKNEGNKGAVITHPHSLYGGDMHNHIVESVALAYRKNGYATLRFNFRGVGRSQGHYDKGIGEQEDVISAISYLFEKGIRHADLAGYSFGAWVNAHTDCKNASNMIMVSPPAGFMDFKPALSMPCLKFVVTGGSDEIAPPDLIRKMLPVWNSEARFEVIKDADHFYSGCVEKLESLLSDFISEA
ncbi:alpha/beta hydrolase [Desulfococcaceae bacterium HSG8]|nr:alpha/beta hydrolase [Desulfococcaceae bacterium HSG8]